MRSGNCLCTAARALARTAPPARAAGFTYLAVLLLVALIGLGLSSAATLFATAQQRERELELLFIGNQYRQAIGSYYESTPGGAKQFPPTLEALLKDERHPVTVRHLRKLYADHVVFHAGDEDFAPGITLRLCDGHTAGLMVVCCETARGTVVLASDAAHLYANLTRRIPFPIFVDEPAYVSAQQRVMDLAGGSLDHLIPGHDPLVLRCFPSENDIARVDLPPVIPIAQAQ